MQMRSAGDKVDRRYGWTVVLAVMICARSMLAQAVVAPAPADLPRIIDHYSLESVTQASVSSDRIYRYADESRTPVDVLISSATSNTAQGVTTQILRRDASYGLRQLLNRTAEANGSPDHAYTIALSGAHVDSLTSSQVVAYRLVAVERRGKEISLLFVYSAAWQQRIVRVTAVIPQAAWERTDTPLFADKLLAALESKSPASSHLRAYTPTAGH